MSRREKEKDTPRKPLAERPAEAVVLILWPPMNAAGRQDQVNSGPHMSYPGSLQQKKKCPTVRGGWWGAEPIKKVRREVLLFRPELQTQRLKILLQPFQPVPRAGPLKFTMMEKIIARQAVFQILPTHCPYDAHRHPRR